MNQQTFNHAQRSYDALLPEPEGKFRCRQCGEWRWESNRSESNPNVCVECEEGETE